LGEVARTNGGIYSLIRMSSSPTEYGQPIDGPLRPNRTWFGRNWKWFVPVMVATAVLLFGLLFAGVFELVTSLTTSSDPYKMAVQRAEDSPQVAQEFGRPLKVGGFASGNIDVSGDSGEAEFSIPISGPRETGHIEVNAKKENGKWLFHTLEVEVDGQDTVIPLLTPEISDPGKPADLI
jgi:Cytochrome oxidase complex assembly protein 1